MYNLQICGFTRPVTLKYGTPDKLNINLLARTPIHTPVGISTIANVPVLTAKFGDDQGSHQVLLAVSVGSELAETNDLFAFEVTPQELDFLQRQMKLPAVCICTEGLEDGEGGASQPGEAVYIRSHLIFGPGGIDKRDAEIADRVRTGRQ